MEQVLLVITGLSVALTVGLAIVLVRVLSEDRRRSEARVALLAELSSRALPPRRPAATDVRPASHTETVRPVPSAAAETVRRPPVRPAARPAPPAASIADLELRPAAAAVTGVGEMFRAPEAPSPWVWRFVAIAATAAVAAFGGLVLRQLSAPAARVEPPPAAAAAPAAAPARPLELMQLSHARTDETLTITGLVQNPRGASPLVQVTATAVVLGPGGSVLASGRAPLDFSTVGPGEESPFVINVPIAGAIERYRIAFRDGQGQVLAHVDRRGPEAVARK